MSTEQRRHDIPWADAVESVGDAKNLGLVGEAQAIAALGLDGRRAGAEHAFQATLGALGELFFGFRSGGGYSAENAPAGGEDLLIARPRDPLGKLPCPPAGEHQVGVAIDKTRKNDATPGVDALGVGRDPNRCRQPVRGADVNKVLAASRDGGVGKLTDLLLSLADGRPSVAGGHCQARANSGYDERRFRLVARRRNRSLFHQ